jgi:hypothetical protein
LETNRGVNDVLLNQKEQAKVDEVQGLLDWLTTLDFDKERNDFFLRRQGDTGTWFVESLEFQTWLQTPSQTLFCPGFPGVGKTILAAIALETISNIGDTTTDSGKNSGNFGLGYVFGNFRRADELTCLNVLASLTRQLAERGNLPVDVAKLLRQHKGRRSRPQEDELQSALMSVASRYEKVFLVVDALDEFDASERVKLVSRLFEIQQSGKIDLRVLATSRTIPDIMSQFEDAQRLEVQASEEDIRRYLKGKIFEFPPFVRTNEKLLEDIIAKVSEAVKGV